MSKINLLNFTCNDLEKFFPELGEKPFRASQVIKWIHKLGVTDFTLMTNLSLTLRQYLSEHCEVKIPAIVKEQVALDGTIKWLLQLEDNYLVEFV